MTDETILAIAREVGWNTEHKASNDYLIKFARALMDKQKAWFTVDELNEWATKLPQTTHWEGCEAVHPECKTEQEPDGLGWLKRDSGYFNAPTPRQWVGLTKQDVYDLYNKMITQEGNNIATRYQDFAKYLEAKLKEKNT